MSGQPIRLPSLLLANAPLLLLVLLLVDSLHFVFARLLHGEFGHAQDVAALDLIGVESASEHHGIGQTLMQALTETMKKRGVKLLHSETDWTNHGLVRFFASSGFALAPRLLLERSVAEPLLEPSEED